MSKHKAYLGDSVYADFDGLHVVLTMENGMDASNTIYPAEYHDTQLLVDAYLAEHSADDERNRNNSR